MESLVLKVLSFDVAVPTANWFCDNLLKECNADDKTRALAMVSKNCRYHISAACAYKKMSKFILVFHLKQIEVKFWYIFVVLDWNDNGWRWCVPEIPAQCDCFSSRVSGPLLPWTGSLGKYSVFVRYTCIWQTSLKKITWEYASVDFCEELL